MNTQDWFPLGWTGLISLDIQGTLKSLLQPPQFKIINYLALSLLYGTALISIHDYWKSHCFDYTSFDFARCQGRKRICLKRPGVRASKDVARLWPLAPAGLATPGASPQPLHPSGVEEASSRCAVRKPWSALLGWLWQQTLVLFIGSGLGSVLCWLITVAFICGVISSSLSVFSYGMYFIWSQSPVGRA